MMAASSRMRRFLALLLAVLCLASVPAQARQWVRAELPGVVLYSDGYQHELQRWALRLRLFDALLRQTMDLPATDAETGSPLTVYLLDEGKDAERLTGRKNLNGLYSPSIEGSFLIASRAPGYRKEALSGQAVLFHEYAHHFMYRHFTSAWPAWYREGMAEYAGAVTFDADWTASVGQPNWPRLHHLDGKPMPLETILASSVNDFPPGESARFYAWSWKLVYLLSMTADDRERLRHYLRLFAAGTDPMTAARAAFGDPKSLESRLHALVPDPRGGRQVPLAGLPRAEIAASALDPSASRLVDLRLERLAGADRKRALTGLRALVASAPGNAEARRELALALLPDSIGEAGEQARLATTLAPGDTRAQAVWADIAMRRIKADPASTPADWDTLRAMLAKAIGPDTRDPYALSLLFRTYLAEPRPAPPAAHAAMDRALALQPESYEVRLLAVYSLASRGRLEEARRTAEILASDPHSGTLGKRALDLLATLRPSSLLPCTSGATPC
jgi:hypothetical protein